jgi:hypothetical protein
MMAPLESSDTEKLLRSVDELSEAVASLSVCVGR